MIRLRRKEIRVLILFVASWLLLGVTAETEPNINKSAMSLLTVIAAWWGAGVATIVFLFECYKWTQTAPKIEIGVSPNMQILDPNSELEKEKYISVTLSNNGGKPTTVTQLGAVVYQTHFQKWRRKNSNAMLFINPITSKTLVFFPTNSLPALLEIGRTWTGMMQQTDEFTQWIEKGQLYIGVFTSYHKRPLEKRVRKLKYADAKISR